MCVTTSMSYKPYILQASMKCLQILSQQAKSAATINGTQSGLWVCPMIPAVATTRVHYRTNSFRPEVFALTSRLMHAGALSLCPSAANGDACLWGQLSSRCQQISHQGACEFKIARLCHDICCAVPWHALSCALHLICSMPQLGCTALH